MNDVVFNFKKKSREEEMYNKIIKRLIKNGYTLKSTRTHCTLSCTHRTYPYQIKISYKKSA